MPKIKIQHLVWFVGYNLIVKQTEVKKSREDNKLEIIGPYVLLPAPEREKIIYGEGYPNLWELKVATSTAWRQLGNRLERIEHSLEVIGGVVEKLSSLFLQSDVRKSQEEGHRAVVGRRIEQESGDLDLYAVKFRTEKDFEIGGRYILMNTDGPGIGLDIFCVERGVLREIDRLGVNYDALKICGHTTADIANYFNSIKR